MTHPAAVRPVAVLAQAGFENRTHKPEAARMNVQAVVGQRVEVGNGVCNAIAPQCCGLVGFRIQHQIERRQQAIDFNNAVGVPTVADRG